MTTSNRGNWILGVELCPGNPYDGHTLSAALKSFERNTGTPISVAYVYNNTFVRVDKFTASER